jgi:hypothetical protein
MRPPYPGPSAPGGAGRRHDGQAAGAAHGRCWAGVRIPHVHGEEPRMYIGIGTLLIIIILLIILL